MRLFLRLFLLLILVSVVGLFIAIFLTVQNQPLLENSAEISVEDVRRARAFMENSDPRNLQPGEISAFTVSDADLELLMNYGLSRLQGGAVNIELEENQATAEMTARLMDNPLGNFLNIQVGLSQWGDALVIEQLQVGSLAIPGWIADFVAQSAHRQLQRIPEYAAALEAINGYSISPGQVNVVYQWQPELVDRISDRGRDLLVSQDEQDRLLAHASNLSNITNDTGLSNVTSLASVLGPMFQFAQARGGDPVEENRAALLVTSMYILGINVPRVLGLPVETIRPPGRHRLTLSARHDFAQHFLVSAGLTVSAGSVLADTIGLLKELDDSQGGSGFSFTDIGADRSGVRFAELAIANRTTAQAVQTLMLENVSEELFMAEFRDLPEFLTEEEFISRFGGVGEPAYNAIIEEIENRISSTPLFQELDASSFVNRR